MEQILENAKPVERAVATFLSCDENVAEKIMIENAALALERAVKKMCKKKRKSVLILCGSGNNGADGYTLARHLFGIYDTAVVQCAPPKSVYCREAFENVNPFLKQDVSFFEISSDEISASVKQTVENASIIVDCIFGTGFHGVVEEKIKNLFRIINACPAKKISCDVPSGIDSNPSRISPLSLEQKKEFIFFADKTVSMGAHKISLFSDCVKDAVGKIERASIGVSPSVFFDAASRVVLADKIFLLEKSDARFPVRTELNTHKGSFGHACVVSGEKKGAAILCAVSALRCGAGLSSIVNYNAGHNGGFSVPACIMQTDEIPENTSAVVLGPGFGRKNEQQFTRFLRTASERQTALLFDADAFYYRQCADFILNNEKQKIVLTPHPKEFSQLLYLAGMGEHSVSEIAEHRVEFVRLFCKTIGNCALILKGANTFIGYKDSIYICTRGKPCLSKGGSGDVLSGVIAGLLAQGYGVLDACITGVLMHAEASRSFKKNYAMLPEDLILKL